MMRTATPERTRLKASLCGAIQGVGFRPFVFRLAEELGLDGWVNNTAQGVVLEVEGRKADLQRLLLRLEREKPPRSSIQSLECSWLDPVGYSGFEIRRSKPGGSRTALVLPDIATCTDCRREIFDPQNRRYFYPFTNCTHCGPRFSIIESLPYDRANTSMRKFRMCRQCRAEYNNPRDRRFHAQPNACPVCGPRLELWNPAGEALHGGREALLAAARALRRGRIVAVKGLGGFHLMVAARLPAAIRRLRERKHREEKPFALMFPSLEAVRNECEVSRAEERLLRSPEAPIVLLRKISNLKSQISNWVAPGNPNLGVLLPYTPLHHLLTSLLGFPVVATSGNLSDEPICIDEHEARQRLGRIADLFLVHDRPIVRHVDDSIARVVLDRELVLRRARGYAPLPVLPEPGDGRRQKAPCVLAVGAHLKNTIALTVGHQVFVSQHIGDLETEQACAAFQRVIADFEKLYAAVPATVAADLHPDYFSTQYARARVEEPPGQGWARARRPTRLLRVQHHSAHVLSCMAENEVKPPVLGVAWDGTGYGLDGTIWGGEFFLVTETGCERVAHLRTFRLPGGEAAMREPRRSALGLLHAVFGDAVCERKSLPPLASFTGSELALLAAMLRKGLNAPFTSSAGRLFDAVSSLCGLRQHSRYEGQAAMDLEFALEGIQTTETYPLRLPEVGRAPDAAPAAVDSPMTIDWAPMVRAIIADIEGRTPAGIISARFHNALAALIVEIGQRAGTERVVLSGGCFQNRYLTERSVGRLRQAGLRPYWHQRLPPNDGGIAPGQIIAALRTNR
jgi:hydrogenase maturation protein HypF